MIAKGIRSIHSYCIVAFKHHTVQTIVSTSHSPLFNCLGYCLFDDCPVEVEVKVQDELSLKAFVTFHGDGLWHHCEELKRQPVRAGERDGIADALTTKLPRSLHQDLPECVKSIHSCFYILFLYVLLNVNANYFLTFTLRPSG